MNHHCSSSRKSLDYVMESRLETLRNWMLKRRVERVSRFKWVKSGKPLHRRINGLIVLGWPESQAKNLPSLMMVSAICRLGPSREAGFVCRLFVVVFGDAMVQQQKAFSRLKRNQEVMKKAAKHEKVRPEEPQMSVDFTMRRAKLNSAENWLKIYSSKLTFPEAFL